MELYYVYTPEGILIRQTNKEAAESYAVEGYQIVKADETEDEGFWNGKS